MKKITSFTIDHIKLQPGVYVSRKDPVGDQIITTFDLRMTSPNEEPVMNTAEMHTIEHLAATFLRNHAVYGDKTIYFGPMGCRTGFYLLLAGDYASKDIVPLMIEMFEFIRDFKDEVPGASPKDCGNYLDNNLKLAKIYMKADLFIRTKRKGKYRENRNYWSHGTGGGHIKAGADTGDLPGSGRDEVFRRNAGTDICSCGTVWCRKGKCRNVRTDLT